MKATLHLWIAVGILALTMVLLVSNRLRIDVVGIIALVLVGIFGLVSVNQLFSGFSSYAAIIIAAMFALGEGLRQSGLTDLMASLLEKVAKSGEKALVTVLLIFPPVPSTFISDVGLMGIFLPTMLRIRQDLKVSLHRLLMPLAVSIALGGLLSMIGSAGNIIGNTALVQNHIAPIGLFAITPLGAILVFAGFLFMRTWGIRHLPEPETSSEFLTDYTRVKSYMTEIRVGEESPLLHKPLQDIEYFQQHHVSVVRIFRPDHQGVVVAPGPSDRIGPGDHILVQGDQEAILTLSNEQGFEVLGPIADRRRLREGDARVVEALVPQGSILSNHTLREMDFRTRYGISVLAILRQGVTRVNMLPNLRLRSGDVLLVEGSERAVNRVQLSHDLIVLADRQRRAPGAAWKLWVAGGTVLAVLLVAAFNVLNIEVAAAAGLAVMLLSRILSPDQIYRAVDWRIVTLIGGITPLSLALNNVGFTALVSHALLGLVGPLGPIALLAVFFWLAALLTQVVSNVAAALVLSPLAITMAHANSWSPYPLIITMIVALSAAPLTPLANKVFLMAMGPGRYRYQDFITVGGPLTLVMFGLSMLLVPLMFPFTGALALGR